MKIKIRFKDDKTTQMMAKRIASLCERVGGTVTTNEGDNDRKVDDEQRDDKERVGEVWEG